MKVKVPGAESSTGVKPLDFTLPKGDYVLELGAASIKEWGKSPGQSHNFPGVVIDGPEFTEGPNKGKSTQGRKYTHRISEMFPEHESFSEASKQRTADEIADICKAAGVEYDPEEGYETEDFAGKRIRVRLGIRQGKDEAGEPRPESVVQQQRDEDGHVHLFLSDDGKPIGGSSKAPSKKASSSSSRRR